jgi:predicted membrane protein
MGRIIAGTVLVLLGLSALLGISLMKFILAFIFIAIGIRILSGKNSNKWRHNCNFDSSATIVDEDLLNEVAIFSPVNKNINSTNFNGGKVVMIFSGGKIDLSQVKTSEKNITLEVVAIFGGGKIIIPKNWKVNSQGTAIFGGYNSKVEAGSDEVILNIKGAAIFGGIEIVN